MDAEHTGRTGGTRWRDDDEMMKTLESQPSNQDISTDRKTMSNTAMHRDWFIDYMETKWWH